MSNPSQENILQHYDELSRLALSKCTTQSDAEDLVSDTMLAAFSYLHGGGKIEHPKTWLASTFMHKWNSLLRRRYRTPATVCIDSFLDTRDGDITEDSLYLSDGGMSVDDYLETDEGAEVRKTLNYLAKTTRSVLIRYYYNGESVAEIAKAMNIPEGTVKSRLFSGRDQMKKGLTAVEIQKNHIPGTLCLSFSGKSGKNMRPLSLVEGDLIAQNLLVLAYEKPHTCRELAELLGIPTVYIEPIVTKLYEGELMALADHEKYYTDFIIYSPEDSLATAQKQKNFVREHFALFWRPIDSMVQKAAALPYTKTLTERQKQKLLRFLVLRVLQAFTSEAAPHEPSPPRHDGGAWNAMGWQFPAEYDFQKHTENEAYRILGGHRTSGTTSFYGASFLSLHEFDTAFFDHPYRHQVESYFDGMASLLWCIYRGIDPAAAKIHTSLIESIPFFVEQTGLLTREGGLLAVDIPVMDRTTSQTFSRLISKTFEALKETLGAAFHAFLEGAAMKLPPHLKSVPMIHRYHPATQYIAMQVVRMAHEKGLHMQGVDYCCPPVILVYEAEGDSI